MNPSQPLRPLTVGNVVSAGLRLYNDNRKAYLLVALRAVGWTLLGFLYAVLLVGFMVAGALTLAAARSGDSSIGGGFILIGIAVLLILPGIPLWIFCVAKRIYHATLISRSAYLHLSNQPEPISQGHATVRRKFWPFWLARVLVGLILYVPNLASSFLQQIFGIGLGVDNQVVAAISGVLVFAVVLATWVIQMWLSARLVVPEVAMAMEPELQTAKSIPRSWNLTKGNGLRILLILLVAFLVTLPLYTLAIVPAILSIAFLIPTGAWQAISATRPTPSAISAILLGMSVAFGSYILLLQLLEILVIPFWQSIKAVLYYDLRNRREGIGLTLSDQ